MSRVGKKPILIPEDVEVKIEGQKVIISGPKGELFREIRPEIKIEVKGNQIFVSPQAPSFRRAKAKKVNFLLPLSLSLGKAKVEKKETSSTETPEGKSSVSYGAGKKTKAFWGTSRAHLANMVQGVKEGYEKKLEIEGVGYKASVEGGDTIQLSVGFTKPTKIKAPKDIKFSVEKNVITVSGADIELVGLVAAKIRKVRPPEPYKGKGIRYQGEIVRRKVGKRAVTTTK